MTIIPFPNTRIHHNKREDANKRWGGRRPTAHTVAGPERTQRSRREDRGVERGPEPWGKARSGAGTPCSYRGNKDVSGAVDEDIRSV